MTLIVECPSGCEIHVSRKDEGKIICCPECAAAIRLPRLSQQPDNLPTAQTIHCRAKIATVKRKPPPQTNKQPQTSQTLPAPPPAPDHFHEQPAAISSVGSNQNLTSLADETWETRLEDANADRRSLARSFAICIFILGVVNIIPAFQHASLWTNSGIASPYPVWIYLQACIGGLCFLAGLYLTVRPAWSALRGVAIVMLVLTFVFGFAATGLLTGHDELALTNFLGMPFSLNRQASIWCIVMLCLVATMAYWGGKESLAWERSDKVLKQISTKTTI